MCFAIAEEIKTFLAAMYHHLVIDVFGMEWPNRISKTAFGLLLRNGLQGFALVFLFSCESMLFKACPLGCHDPYIFLVHSVFFECLRRNINYNLLFAINYCAGLYLLLNDAVVGGESIILWTEDGKNLVWRRDDGVKCCIWSGSGGVLTTMARLLQSTLCTGTFGQIFRVPFQ